MSEHKPTPSRPESGRLPQRLYFLDWLRILALAVLMLYHVGMLYVTWPFHIKSPFASTAIEPLMLLTAPWRMSLLFLVSGAATALMLRNGATVTLLRTRSRFLLLPLLAGMLLLVVPQAYVEMARRHAFEGSVVDFAKQYYGLPHEVCTGRHCTILPTWNHLWFLPYLWAYTLIAWCIARLAPASWRRLTQGDSRALRGMVLLVAPLLLLVAARSWLAPRFPSTHAFVDDWFNHAMFFAMFLLGAAVATRGSAWDTFERARWPALVLALVAWAALVLAAPAPSWRPVVLACQQWSAVVAAVGFAHRWLNVDHPWRAVLTEAVFPIYVLHQTVIIVASHALLPWGLRPMVEAAAVVGITVVACGLGYLVARDLPRLRPWVGMKARTGVAHATADR